MTRINLYSTKPTQDDFPLLAQHRLTEIELFLLFQKLKNHAPVENVSTGYAAETLMEMLNKDNTHTEMEMDLFRGLLTRNEEIIPTMDEYIVYLRTQQLGINKVTAITKKQHYYLTKLLSNYDLSTFTPELGYEWNWNHYTVIQDVSHHLARDLFHTHTQDFHDTLGFKFPKVKKPKKGFTTTRRAWF